MNFHISKDTTHHLTGYSVRDVTHSRIKDGNYYVVLYGKSNAGHRALGEYIYAAFRLKQNWMITLEAINNPSNEGFAGYTLGAQCHFATEYIYGAFGAFINSKKGKYQLIIVNRRSSYDKEQVWFRTIESDIYSNYFFQFEENCDKYWSDVMTASSAYVSDLGFDKIVGIYSDYSSESASQGALYLVARTAKSWLRIYPMINSTKNDFLYIGDLKVLEINIKHSIKSFISVSVHKSL